MLCTCVSNAIHFFPTGVDKVRHDLCIVQYYFEDESHEIHPRSHGNSKEMKPYVCSKNTEWWEGYTKESLQNCSGVIGAQSIGSIPKSRSQVHYLQSKKAQTSSSVDPLFSMMLQCK